MRMRGIHFLAPEVVIARRGHEHWIPEPAHDALGVRVHGNDHVRSHAVAEAGAEGAVHRDDRPSER